jgi:nucleotidyltransferase substrate binding protein (TIGR01987 family)
MNEQHPKDIRWRQRFMNFDKAFRQLDSACQNHQQLDDLSKEGLIQRFEYTFELAWKTLKDYLEAEGETDQTPRAVIKKSFQIGLINNGEIWMDMLAKRNLMAHTYNEETFQEVMNLIVHHYHTEIKQLHSFLDHEQ